jgi:hypothetical protein
MKSILETKKKRLSIESLLVIYCFYTFPKVYNCSIVGDKLPPAGSRVIPKLGVTCIAYSKIRLLFLSKLSNSPILVGVKGLSFRAHTWYTIPLGGSR